MKNTLQRQIIFDAVEELDIHATAEQVYEHINKTYPAIGKATVYRNLKQLAESGELQNIGNLSGAAHYDHNLHEHFHFICTKCRKVSDVPGSITDVIDKAVKSDDFEITGCHVCFSGLCKNCQ